MWLLTSLAFFYIVIQYHVSSTWPLPIASGGNDIQDNKIDLPKRLWLRRIVGDEKFAEEVQNAIGEYTAKDLATRIDRQLTQCALQNSTGESAVPTIYIVTPTYRRPEQQAELTRLAQTLMHVENIYWLLIEDAKEKSKMVSQLLKKTGIRSVHLHGKSHDK